jgi:hypothetical protein
VRLVGEVWVEEGSRASALEIVVEVVEGFSAAFQASNSTGEKLFVNLSPKLSDD